MTAGTEEAAHYAATCDITPPAVRNSAVRAATLAPRGDGGDATPHNVRKSQIVRTHTMHKNAGCSLAISLSLGDWSEARTMST